MSVYLCLLFTLCFCIVINGDDGICKIVNSCSCQYSNGDVVDLSPLKNMDGTPRFADVTCTVNTDLFSYNPCVDFSEGSCAGVAACQVRPMIPTPSYYSLGSQSSAKFITGDGGKLSVQYSATQAGVLRTVNIVLTCTTVADVLVATGERGTSANYDLELQSPHACPKKSGGGGNSVVVTTSISTGSVLVIVFFCGIFLFFVVGMAVQIFVRKQSGRRVIPLYDSFAGLPSLIKDGTLFVLRKERSSYGKL